ncbi:carbohydrate kinase family protein [Martelella mediterranea]|uniref:2-dehydro-3-deoxygluconokinase n=1 Tax=Martelella mediterranea DSM 17316 TaxID=1122214 RepID=A0A1U9YXJ8_9HYPH|nr:carbohydrate kinase [Martelella mediterranea]AQZ50156.1 2-dehydro-3-deoxygluconokinase [Martelella mediterranea DSM 17316]
MILCCGEALIDMLPRETTKGEPAFSPYAGGAVCNTAVALARLGRPTGFFSGLSSDLMGDIIREKLDASNVDHSYVATSDRPTTLAFVKLVNGAASYAFYDENTAGRMITEADLPEIGDDCRAMHFGAISLIPEPCGSTYEALLMREAEKRVISLDPNIRPSFITDADKHRARIERMAAKADILKFSDEDLDWFGLEGSLDDKARHWIAAGASLVVVTRGSDSTIGYTATEKVEVASEKVEVVDTVGAGDTFDAGILASLDLAGLLTKDKVRTLSANAIRDALALGAKAAAVTVSRAGANPPFAHEIGL